MIQDQEADPTLVEQFLRASVGGPEARAARLLKEHPEIESYGFRTAVVLGDAGRVRGLLADDPGLALRPDTASGWPPLLGVCSSRWHRIDPKRADGMLAVARMFLEAGADPNTSARQGQPGHCSTLYGAAGTANNPALTRLLLERGAIPDDHTVYLSAFFPDHECLRLLLPHVTHVEESEALAAPISTGDVEGVRLLLEAGVNPERTFTADLLGETRAGDPPISPVAAAIELRSPAEMVELLLQHGGDPHAPGRDGRSPLRMATRQGRTDIVEILRRHGARDQVTEIDRFLAACRRAGHDEAHHILTRQPDLLRRLTDEDRGAIVEAAEAGDTEAVRLMLELGFPLNARAGFHAYTPLHAAVFSGNADLVRLLLAAGADLGARDTTWNSTPLEWATVGSGLNGARGNPHADFVATIRALIEAGAPIEDARPVPAKPPSHEVAEFLLGYGITPAEDGG